MTVGAGSGLESQRWIFDGLGRVVRDELALPSSRTGGRLTFYNAMGWTKFLSERSATPSQSVGTTIEGFDPFGRPKTVQAADGKISTLEYRGVRVVKRSSRVWNGTREAVATRREDYDSLGRLMQVKEPNGTWTRYSYDVGGRLTTVVNNSGTGNSANSQTRTFKYDGRGFLARETQPESGTLFYQYDARGNVTRRATPTGTTLTEYDEAGRLLIVKSSSQYELSRLVYRPDGKVSTALAFNDRKVGAACTRFEVRQDFSYDPVAGRLSSEDTTLRQWNVAQPVQKWSQSYLYDGAGRITQVTYPYCLVNCAAAPRNVTTTYDQGRPTAVSGFATAITYHDNGTLNTIRHANNVLFTAQTDPTGIARTAALQADLGANKLWPREDYLYDGAGNIEKIGAKSFSYDLSSRLSSALVPSAGALPYQAYTYDAFNNLTRVARGASAANISTYVDYGAAPATNRLQGASYDGSGNLLAYQGSSYSWDRLQHLSSVTTGSETWVHTYNASGERVWSWRTAPSRVDTYAVRSADGKVLTDFTQVGSTYTWEDYVYREGQLLGAALSDGSVRHFDVDHLGSVRLETSAAGAVAYRDFWPYGEEATPPGGTEQMKFTGHERDLGDPSSTADDLDYMHARYYRPVFARFLSADPVLRLEDALQNPQGWNRYAYVMGNPLRYIDPTGEYRCKGSPEDCKSIEGGMEMLQKAADNLPSGSKENRALKKVIAFYGKPDEDNGVTVVANSSMLADSGGGTSTVGRKTTIGVNLAVYSLVYGGSGSERFLVEVGDTLAHEGQHGLDGQKFGPATTRAQEKAAEIRAFTTASYLSRGLGVDSSWNTWTRGKGIDPKAIDAAAEVATKLWCKFGGTCQ